MITIFTFIVNAQEPPAPSPEDLSEVDEVIVVTATRTPTKISQALVATEVIDRAAIEASGAADLEQLLEMAPGLQLIDGLRGPGLSLGGHDPAHTLVLVDGRRTLGRIGGGLDLRRFTTDRIERIEIVRGPASAAYGADALAGVVQIITRGSEDAWFVDAAVTAGGYAGPAPLDASAVFGPVEGAGAGLDQLGVDVSAGFARERIQGRGGVSLQGWDGWDRDPTNPATSGDAQRRIAPTVHLAAQAGQHRLTLDLDGLLVDGQGIDATAAGATLDRLHRTESWDGGLRGVFALPREVALDARVDLSVYRDQVRVDQRQSDAYDDDQETREVLGRAVVQVDGRPPGAPRHQLQGGAEALIESVTADRIDPAEVGRQRGAVHVQHAWSILDRPRLALLWGARLELDSLFGIFPVPRAALRIDPHRLVSLRVSGGAGYRAPDFKQLYLSFANPGVGYRVDGNPELRPERSWGVHGDLTLHPHADIDLSVSVWHDALFDLIGTDIVAEVPGAITYGYVNIGRARVQGLVASVDVSPHPSLSLRIAYTLTDADDLDLNRPLPGRAEHQGNLAVSVRDPSTRLSLAVNASVLGPRPFYTTDDPTLATLVGVTPLLDARLAWQALPELELFVGIDNATDAGGTLFDATRARRVYGGLTMHLAPRSRSSGDPE